MTETTVGPGTVAVNPQPGPYLEGTTITLTAVPTAGSRFTGWNGDLSGTNNPITLTLDSNKVVRATFTALWTLTTSATAGGTVLRNPDVSAYLDGSVVTLTAVPDTNRAFVGWSGSVARTNNPLVLVMSNNVSIKANFSETFKLTTSTIGIGSVVLLPKKDRYLAGEIVQANAIPAPRNEFVIWSGANSTTNATISMVLTNDTNITARFQPAGSPIIFVNGQRASNLDLTNVNSVQVEIRSSFTKGTIFYTLDGSEPTFTSTPYASMITLAQSATIRAVAYSTNFVSASADPVTINLWHMFPLAASSKGGGTVNVAPLAAQYRNDATVQVTAVADLGWTFLGWSGDGSGTNPVLSVTMEQPKSVQANFGTSINFISNTNGAIAFNPRLSVYAYGSVVQVAAIPKAGNFFALWGTDLSGNVNPQSVTITAPNQVVSALFAPLTPGHVTLTALANGNGVVSANPSANTYTNEEMVILTATAQGTNKFLGWSGDATGTNNPMSVFLTRSKIITANFTGGTYPPLQAVGMVNGRIVVQLTGAPDTSIGLQSSTNLID